MRQTIAIALMVGLAFAGSGCGKKDKKGKDKGGDTTAKGGEGGGAAKNYPALTAEAAPADLTPAEKTPFEALVFKMTGKRDKGGFPEYDIYNLGTKNVKFAYIDIYGYDKDGKQVVRKDPPLSWNGDVKPGTKSDWPLDIEQFKEGVVPESAVSFDVCYSSIKFEGDASATDDNARCPDNKPKAK